MAGCNVERFVPFGPRHIEVQVLGDQHGAVVQLGVNGIATLQRRPSRR